MQADAAVIYRPYSSQSGRYEGAFVAAFPRDALDTLLAQQRRTFVTIGSVVFLAASALGWLIANRLTGRLATISRAARDLQKGSFGNLTELEQFSGQSDEIARLGQVVHDMGKEVQNREAILEGEVRKRTEELALRNEALAASQAMIRGELELAKRLQLGILPSRFPSCGGYEGSARVRMQQQMGGDFYDFIPRADGSVAVVVADVSGKGIAAAFFMAMARTSLAEQLTQGLGIEECLSRSNEVLCQSNPLNLFVTVFVALIEPNSGRVCYANAGHNPPVHLFPQGDPQLLPMRGELALGVMEGVRYSLDTLHLKPGEALLTYTDGITEAFDDEGRAYGETRLLQWARLLDHQASAEQSLTSLLNDVDSFQDAANQSDDITMALIRRLPNV
jgi:sigma-B regulation protein RsbU (phosphoserine phosphatase)